MLTAGIRPRLETCCSDAVVSVKFGVTVETNLHYQDSNEGNGNWLFTLSPPLYSSNRVVYQLSEQHMNLCCMDNTQQKVLCKYISVFLLSMLLLYQYRDEVKNECNLPDIVLFF